MLGKGLNRVVNNIMYTDRGRFILSIILGLGLPYLEIIVKKKLL